MILDVRDYAVAPGKLDAYLRRHMAEALPVMRHHLGEPFGYFAAETGVQPAFLHMWRYADNADREQRRAALYADPRWNAYRASVGETGWVLRQENRLLRALEIPPPG
jgi:hypothetical protein